MGKAEDNKQQKRLSLLNTAFELFTTKGVNKTSIAEISEQAGIAKGTFYLYFTDKYDIRNKLISHKSGVVLTKAIEALREQEDIPYVSSLDTLKQTIIFIADNIINQLCDNKALLTFISKNLSWGLFKKAIASNAEENGIDFRKVYYSMLEKSGIEFENPEIMLFMIIELVSSTCYSAILYNEPVPINELKPQLFNTIGFMIESQIKTK